MRSGVGNKDTRPEPKGSFTKTDNLSTKVDSVYEFPNEDRSSTGMSKVQLPLVLKELMSAHRVSARALAKACNIPVSTISTYLSGNKSTYSPEHLRCLSEHFNVSIDFLLYRKSSIPKNLNLLKTDQLFEGWLKVRIDKVVPSDDGNNSE